MGRKTWLSPVVDLVQEKTGTPPNYKSWAREIRVLHKDCGFTMKAIVANLQGYLAQTPTRYVSAPRFRVTFNDWNPGQIAALEIDRQLDRDQARRAEENERAPRATGDTLERLHTDIQKTLKRA